MHPSVTPPTREALDAWCRGFVASVYNAGYAHAANDNKPDAEFVVRLTAELSARFPGFPVAVVEAAERIVKVHQIEPCQHLFNAHGGCQWCHWSRPEIDALTLARHILSWPGIDEGDGWRPIETAPKDGTRVLIAHRLWNPVIQPGYFYVEEDERLGRTFDTWRIGHEFGWTSVGIDPTHWQPLPGIPRGKAGGE